jgi:hypothetical protein
MPVESFQHGFPVVPMARVCNVGGCMAVGKVDAPIFNLYPVLIEDVSILLLRLVPLLSIQLSTLSIWRVLA